MVNSADSWPLSWKLAEYTVAFFQFVLCLCSIFLIFAMASSKAVRSQGYSYYIVFLVVPDAMLNGISAIANVLTPAGLETRMLIRIDYWILFFYYIANFYLNAIVAYEVYAMVKRSHRMLPNHPLSIQKALIQIACVYTLSAFISTWCIIDVPWSPTKFDENFQFTIGSPEGGVFDSQGSLILIIFVIWSPVFFVLYVGGTIWRNRLLSPSGNTRKVYTFFMKIILVFLGFYIPATIFGAIVQLFENPVLQFWITICGNIMYALQGLITLFLAIQNDDIRAAFDENLLWLTCVKVYGNDHISKDFVFRDEERSQNPNQILQNIVLDAMNADKGMPSNGIVRVPARPNFPQSSLTANTASSPRDGPSKIVKVSPSKSRSISSLTASVGDFPMEEANEGNYLKGKTIRQVIGSSRQMMSSLTASVGDFFREESLTNDTTTEEMTEKPLTSNGQFFAEKIKSSLQLERSSLPSISESVASHVESNKRLSTKSSLNINDEELTVRSTESSKKRVRFADLEKQRKWSSCGNLKKNCLRYPQKYFKDNSSVTTEDTKSESDHLTDNPMEMNTYFDRMQVANSSMDKPIVRPIRRMSPV